jgi:hypothetical protein
MSSEHRPLTGAGTHALAHAHLLRSWVPREAKVAGSPEKDPRSVDPVHRRHALHITVVLSKDAHSGPSVCLRARALCPLRLSCPGADRALRFRAPLGARQENGHPDNPHACAWGEGE